MLPRRISNSIRQADFLNIINSVHKQTKITDRNDEGNDPRSQLYSASTLLFIFLFSSFSSSLFFHQILHQQTLWNWHINPNSWVSFDELTYFFRSLTDNNDNSIFFSFSFFVCSPFSSLLSSVLRCCLLKSCSLIFGYKSRFIFGFNLFQ